MKWISNILNDVCTKQGFDVIVNVEKHMRYCAIHGIIFDPEFFSTHETVRSISLTLDLTTGLPTFDQVQPNPVRATELPPPSYHEVIGVGQV